MQLRLAIVSLFLGATPLVVSSSASAQGAPASAAPVTKSSEPKWTPEVCGNDLDDDGDGNVDCADSDCRSVRACKPENCSNGYDDDGDGKTDCADVDECAGNAACLEASHCLDGRDNDRDGLVDCSDDDCDSVTECDEAKAAQKEAKAAEVERALRPYKVSAALKALSQAQKDEVAARKALADDPGSEDNQKELGRAIAVQVDMRKQLGGFGWTPAPVAPPPAVASAPASTPAARPAPAPSAPPSAAMRRVNFTQ